MTEAPFHIPQPKAGPYPTGGLKIAYLSTRRKASTPVDAADILFCSGYASDMQGTKASDLAKRCKKAGLGLTRFDYRGHGESDGRFEDGTIGAWFDDALMILDDVCKGPQWIVGSSMGGWIALLLARARPERLAGLTLVAPAPDFPRSLTVPELPDVAKAALERHGVWHRPSEFGGPPIPITQSLIDESAAHELLNGPSFPIRVPVRILHGSDDEVVPLSHVHRLADWLDATDIMMQVIAGGDHRLSSPEDLDTLWAMIGRASR